MHAFLYLDTCIYNTYMDINGYDLCVHLFTRAYVHMRVPECSCENVRIWKTRTAKSANTYHRILQLLRTLLDGFHNQDTAFRWDPNNFHQLNTWISLISVSILRGKLLLGANNQTDRPDLPLRSPTAIRIL